MGAMDVKTALTVCSIFEVAEVFSCITVRPKDWDEIYQASFGYDIRLS